MVSLELVPCPCRCGPVHARHCQCQEASYNYPSPDEVHPMTTPVEEETEGYQASPDRNAGSAENVRPTKDELIIRRTVIAKIVHLRDGSSSAHTAHDQ